MHRRWLSLPLLSSCVSAFYPYQNGDASNSKSKRFIPIEVGHQSPQGSGLVTLDIKKMPAKRDNKFTITNSSKPAAQNAMAINQDGADFTYFSTMKFGSPGRDMYMLIDTGSANTWVMGSSCVSSACQVHNTLGGADSATLKTSKETWSLAYGTGQVQGVMATDTIGFANYSVELGFGLASTTSDDFNNYPMDGILGLGRASSDTLGTQTIMEVLDDQAELSENIIGIHLHRSSDGTRDGQITFGGVDSSRFSGKLGYTKTANDNSWEIPLDDAGVDGKAIGFKGKSAIIDTGTSYILMPPSDADAVHALIPGSSHNGEVYVVPCTSTANVYVTFSGVKYTISPKDYVRRASDNACNSNIIGHQAFGPSQWILGDVFLKNVYTVFDFDRGRIGFGTKSGDTGSSSSTRSSSSPSSSTASATSTSASGTGAADSSTTSTPSTAESTSTEPTSSSGPTTSSVGSGDSSPFGQAGASSAAPEMTLKPAWLLLAFIVGLML